MREPGLRQINCGRDNGRNLPVRRWLDLAQPGQGAAALPSDVPVGFMD
jgi:hypothetical protein